MGGIINCKLPLERFPLLKGGLGGFFVQKAKEAFQHAGEQIAYHFPDIRKTIIMPKGAEIEIDDILLTRYACYLVDQNGDSRKEEIAFTQNYSGVQTRRIEGQFVLKGSKTKKSRFRRI